MTTTTIRKIIGDRPVQSVTPKTSVRDTAVKMAEHGIGAVAVVEEGVLKGILTERDIVFRAVAPQLALDDLTAEQIMTPDPISVEIDTAISNALATKLGDAFRHLPVMEDGKIVGLLSFRDIPAEYVMLYERFREMTTSRADS